MRYVTEKLPLLANHPGDLSSVHLIWKKVVLVVPQPSNIKGPEDQNQHSELCLETYWQIEKWQDPVTTQAAHSVLTAVSKQFSKEPYVEYRMVTKSQCHP